MSSKDCEITAGDLRHKITIEQVTRVSDGQGGFTETWSTFAAPWAKVEPLSAGQKLWAESLQHRISHKVTTRYFAGVTSDMRITWGSRVFHIKGIRNLEEKSRWLEISAEEGAAS